MTTKPTPIRWNRYRKQGCKGTSLVKSRAGEIPCSWERSKKALKPLCETVFERWLWNPWSATSCLEQSFPPQSDPAVLEKRCKTRRGSSCYRHQDESMATPPPSQPQKTWNSSELQSGLQQQAKWQNEGLGYSSTKSGYPQPNHNHPGCRWRAEPSLPSSERESRDHLMSSIYLWSDGWRWVK